MKSSYNRYFYLFKTFLLIGSTSFGGYMSLIAMMHDKMVERDKRIDDDLITEGVSLASMLPGPVAVNVVTYTGFHLAGVSGAIISATAVLLPSIVLVLLLTWLYMYAGNAIDVSSILKGVFPVVAGIILAAGISMGKKICTNWRHYAIAAISFLTMFQFNSYRAILIVLAAAAVAGMVLFKPQVGTLAKQSRWKSVAIGLTLLILLLVSVNLLLSGTLLGNIFRQFSLVSLSLFGGGYVMIPILKSMLVDQLAWITHDDFLYGISIGQVTPGPILVSATFFGYQVAGFAGACAATIAIFAPSAILMVALSALFHSLKHNAIVQAALAGLKPCVVGLILYSALSILVTHISSTLPLLSVLVTVVSFFLVFKYNVSNAWLVIAGAVFGYLLY